MARAHNTNTSNDGMAWLALMPFPAFTPLNWWALASPRNAALATLNSTRLALDLWRASSDGARAIVRLQQDELLKMLEAQREEVPAKVDGAETADSEKAEEAPFFVQPMLEATRAYNRVGRAFIVAQRDTLRAFSARDEAH